MVKIMRGKNLAFFLLASTLVLGMRPLTAHAELYPIINEVKFHEFASVPGTPSDVKQSALKAGDVITLQVNVDSIYADAPRVTVDLSELGITSPTTTPASAGPIYHEVLHDRAYYSDYVYEFGPFTIGADVPDGEKTIPIQAIDAVGNVASSVTHIVVDNVPPIISLSGITFSTTTPGANDYMYLSGALSETGSSLVTGRVTETLLDANREKMIGGWPWSYTVDYNPLTLFSASSTDGIFSHVPYMLAENKPGEIAEAAFFKLAITAYDAAGNSASTEFVIPLQTQIEEPKVSNVLFLPGIEGSRLYEGTGCGKSAEEMLWEPYESALGLFTGAGDKKVNNLALNTAGTSACSDIYAKEGEIIDAVNGSAIYASLISEMNGLKAGGTINDWKPVAYDWRLSLDDLMSNGAQHGDRIYYGEATSTPYIEQTLRSLATSSKSGKVTIIAHSNGGLVTKALLERLGSKTSKSLVDKIIMVGVPQSGAPLDIGSTLVGYDSGIYSKIVSQIKVPVVTNVAARSLAQNSPMAYHLLPSEAYFLNAGNDPAHPVIRFSGYGYANEELAYGNVIKDRVTLDNFLLAKEGAREKPKSNDLKSAEILNSTLIDYANTTHSALDVWTHPPGIQVSQIAGWGVDTVGGIDFYTASSTLLNFLGSRRRYKPIFIEDGDGTVPVPSALLIASSTDVKNYWLDLQNSQIKHGDIFESADLENFLGNLITNISTQPSTILDASPVSSSSKKLTFFLNQPVSFQIKDVHGRVGATGDSSPTIPGFSYGEFGGVMYITVPEDGQYEVTIQGEGNGLLDLDMQERSGDTITASSTVESIPITENTLVSLTISGGLDTTSPITVDTNGNGQDVVHIVPVVGETVIYPKPQTAASTTEDSVPPVAMGGGAGDPPSSPILVSTKSIIPIPTSPPIELVSVMATTSDATISTSTSTSTSTGEVATAAPVVAAAPARIRIAVKHVPRSVTAANQKQAVPDLSQTASVYGAIHQPIFTKLVIALSDGLHRFWLTIRKLF